MATTATFPMKQNEDGQTKLPEPAATLGDKAKDLTDATIAKVEDAAGVVANTARDAVSSVSRQADRATHAVGSGMESVAHTLREKMPHGGVLGAATSSVAGGLETGGKYLENEGINDIATDVTNLIRRNPIPAILIGAALGYVIGRLASRS
jgi:ElaB/YqjD/DUF883 family membrane-anchored ribosome-binding protein